MIQNILKLKFRSSGSYLVTCMIDQDVKQTGLQILLIQVNMILGIFLHMWLLYTCLIYKFIFTPLCPCMCTHKQLKDVFRLVLNQESRICRALLSIYLMHAKCNSKLPIRCCVFHIQKSQTHTSILMGVYWTVQFSSDFTFYEPNWTEQYYFSSVWLFGCIKLASPSTKMRDFFS